MIILFDEINEPCSLKCFSTDVSVQEYGNTVRRTALS